MSTATATPRTTALIVAAGRGRRFGGDRPKQYAPLGDRCVLAHTMAAFLNHPRVHGVRCVIHPDDQALYDAVAVAFDDDAVLAPVFGGETRQDSVRLGLESLEMDAPHQVLIHDAARPFVSADVIDGVLDALATHPGALPALAVADTLKTGDAGLVTGTRSRDGLFRAQTPQGFHYADVLACHREARGGEFTDDAQLFESAGLPVHLTTGSEDNFKITTEEDLMRAERLLASVAQTRTGMGFDVHRFGDGDHVTLCGVDIPFDRGLEGHSDADVGLHALTDALLGAIAEGDIGRHFPPSDATWRGAASDRFLRFAAERVAALGGTIVNVDVTLICEAPKIAPHTDAMIRRIADILAIVPERVSTKATTTEGLGFTGRGEGIAAQALATVRIPVP